MVPRTGSSASVRQDLSCAWSVGSREPAMQAKAGGDLLRKAMAVFARPREYLPIWSTGRSGLVEAGAVLVWTFCAPTRHASRPDDLAERYCLRRCWRSGSTARVPDRLCS